MVDVAPLSFDWLIAHEIGKRNEAGDAAPPVFSASAWKVSREAKQALQTRIVEVLARGTGSVELEIRKSGNGSCFHAAHGMISAAERGRIDASKTIATMLAEAQTSRTIPGGILLVGVGKLGPAGKDTIILIKAEVQDGFRRLPPARGQAVSLEFIRDLFLTPASKFYKIGVYLRKFDRQRTGAPLGFSALVHDHLVSASTPDRAARYFYDGFLGCAFPRSAAIQTREFYEASTEFIRDLPLPEEKKINLEAALRSFLGTEVAATVDATQFAQRVFAQPDVKDSYSSWLADKGVSTRAFPKDTSAIAQQLKIQRLKFDSNIQLSFPPDRLTDGTIRIEKAELEEDGEQVPVTNITVLSRPKSA